MSKEASKLKSESECFLEVDEPLNDEWMERARALLGEDQEERVQHVQELRSAAAEDCFLSPYSNLLSDTECTRFLRAANWIVHTALELLRDYWGFGAEFGDCVQASRPSRQGAVWSQELIACNKVRDTQGRRVVMLNNIGRWDPAVLSPTEVLGTAFSLLQLLSREERTQIAGVNLVLNAQGFSFKHLRYLGINQMKSLAAILNGSVPLWFRSFHIINHPRVFNIFFGILKPFLNERIRDNIIFHSSLASLHSDFALDLLPPELGGYSRIQNDAEAAVRKIESELLLYIEKCNL